MTIRVNFQSLIRVLSASFVLFFCILAYSYAEDVTLTWDTNAEPDLVGYKIYYKTGSSGPPYNGTGATQGSSPIDVPLDQDENTDPDVMEYTIRGLSNSEIYYFVVTAFDNEKPSFESDYSNETSIDRVTIITSTTPSGGGGGGGGCFISALQK